MVEPIFYFRGLNTYGDDDIHMGPVRCGKMFFHIEKELTQRGLTIYPVVGIGTGTIESTIDHCWDLLRTHPKWNSHKTFHFLGHSMGGLIARGLIHHKEVNSKVKSLITFGCPHQGLPFVDSQFSQFKKLRTLSHFGWNYKEKTASFQHLTPEGMGRFNKKYPNQPSISYASVLCQKSVSELCLPMKVLHSLAKPPAPSDGLIPTESQRHGKVLSHLELDHLDQTGYNFHLMPKAREKVRNEFSRMFDAFDDFWKAM